MTEPEMSEISDTVRASRISWTQERALALTYLALVIVFAVLAFRNLSAASVLATILLFSFVPLGVMLSSRPTARSKPKISNSPMWIGSVFGAITLLLAQLWGMWNWRLYFANFPNHRMDFGNPGFHQDSAFHVSIIHGILNTGFPTTGQHLEPVISYHVLSHYVDALALSVLRLDPWESYSLLFFAKGVALTLALIFFAMKVAERYTKRVFWAVLLIVYPAFTATWHVIGSHGQWFPMLLLVLSAHFVYRVLAKQQRGWGAYVVLSLLVAAFSLGKISIGFSFALVVGFSLFASNPRDWRALIAGALWATFFFFSSTAYSTRISVESNEAVWARFQYSWPEITSVLLLLALGVTLLRVVRNKPLRSFVIGGFFAFLSILGLVFFAVPNSSDSYYFFHGLFSVLLLLAIPQLVEGAKRLGMIGTKPNPSPPVGSSLGAVGLALLLVSPVSSQIVFSPFHGTPTQKAVLAAINDQTYMWLNSGLEAEQNYSVRRAVQGAPLPRNEGSSDPFATQLVKRLNTHVAKDSLVDLAPVLFLTAEQWEELEGRFSSPVPWGTGFIVSAMSGLPLIYGVYDSERADYGFIDYGENSEHLPEESVSEELLCQFDRPVIVLESLENLDFGTLCLR